MEGRRGSGVEEVVLCFLMLESCMHAPQVRCLENLNQCEENGLVQCLSAQQLTKLDQVLARLAARLQQCRAQFYEFGFDHLRRDSEDLIQAKCSV
jgi:hypothetical protein